MAGPGQGVTAGIATPLSENRARIRVCLLLVVLVTAVYAQVADHEFISMDDVLYVSGNAHVRTGFSSDNVRWAFASNDQERTYWHPLTWLAHMLDCELFGLDSGHHHLVNVAIHMVNALLLFLIFDSMTGARWPSAVLALLFALHPVNVDSVAWLAQRKSVLSTLFCLLTVWAYLAWCRRPTVGRYAAMVLAFGLGLLAKPVLVALPCVLLLLDFWPLARLRQLQWRTSADLPASPLPVDRRVGLGRAVAEKVPLLLMSLASVVVTMLWPAGENVAWELRGAGLRLANGAVSLIHYLWTAVVPRNLGIFYPYPTTVPAWQWIAAVVVLAVITAAAIAGWRRRPYLIMGWLWFVGSLVPVSGVLQQGLWPARADRWAYLSFIGIFIVFAWGGAEVFSRIRIDRRLAVALTSAVVATMVLTSWIQTGRWRSSIDLYEHTLRVTEDNHLMHTMLGVALVEKGRTRESIEHFRAAADMDPGYVSTMNLSNALMEVGGPADAADCFRAALQLQPELAWAHNGLGAALAETGDLETAIHHFSEAVRIEEGFEDARRNLERAERELEHRSADDH